MELSASFGLVSRATGGCPNAEASYLARDVRHDARTGQRFEQPLKSGETLIASGMVLPANFHGNVEREEIWNWLDSQEDALLAHRYRRDPERAERMLECATVANRMIINLHNALEPEDAERVVKEIIGETITAHGMVADYCVHGQKGNLHCHILHSTRALTEDGVSTRKPLVFASRGTMKEWAKQIRESAARNQNIVLAEKGLEERVAHESFEARGITFEPLQHEGWYASAFAAEGKLSEKAEENEARRQRNAAMPVEDMVNAVVAKLTSTNATFTEAQFSKLIFDASLGDGETVRDAWRHVVAGAALHVGQDSRGQERFTSHEYAAAEKQMFTSGDELSTHKSAFKFDQARIEKMLSGKYSWLSSEQKNAFRVALGDKDLVFWNGAPGVGKTTELKAIKEETDAGGYRIRGFTLAGSAAEKLQSESGIESRTLASWVVTEEARDRLLEKAERLGHMDAKIKAELARLDANRIKKGDIIVLDEAGMVGTRHWARLITAINEAGARLIATGDTEQFAAIDAGRAFGGLCDRFADRPDIVAQLVNTQRQKGRNDEEKTWMRQATKDLRDGKIIDGLEAYRAAGMIVFHETKADAMAANISDYLDGYDRDPTATRLVMAYRKEDVATINAGIRAGMVERGVVSAEGAQLDGKTYAAGDRFIFLTNDRGVLVKDLGTTANPLDWQNAADQMAARVAETRTNWQIAFDRQRALADTDWKHYHDSKQRANRLVAGFVGGLDGAPKSLIGGGLRGLVNTYYDHKKGALKHHIEERRTEALERAKALDLAERAASPGVRNGTTGMVIAADEGRIIVRLDPTAKGEPSRVVVFDPTATNKRGETIAFDHGYASTYHKSQGQSISGVGALGDEMLRSDSIVVGLSRHEHDFKMHIGKDQFEDFSAFARAVAKAPDKDLVADYAVAHRPAHDRVMALKDLSAEYALQMNDCIEKAAAFDKDAWELPEWDTLKDLKKERNELAKEVLDNFPAHRVAVAQARMSRHQIEVMIGKAKPVLSEADRDAFKRVEAYAAMNDACRDKWNEIKATHPGARSKSHPDYEAYCQMRETRDSAAYALTTENGGREAHRRHAKDVGASWRSIESQAAKYLERQRTKEIGQTVEGTTVVVYTQARQEAGKAFAEAVIAAGDDTPGAKARAAADPTYLAARSTRDQAVVAMAAKLKEAGIDPAKLAEEIKRADLLRSPEAELVRKYRNARRLAGSLYGEISSNDYTEAGREKARIDVRYKEYEAARDARNKTVAEIAKNPAKYEHILKAYGFAAGAVQDDDVAQRTGSREKAGYWPAPKAVIVEIQADEARDKLVDAYITAIKAAGIKPEHFARDLATAEMRAREQSPEAKLVREFADTRIEAGKLYVKMTGGDFSPEARLAATKHEDYGQYRGLKERRDAAVTAIAKDKPRYQEWLDAAGIGDEKFAADLKAASSGVREERKTPAPVEQTVKRSAEPVTPSKSTVAAAVPGQENNIAPPKGEPTTLTAIKVVEPVAGPGPQKTTPVPSAVEVENAAIRKALLAKGAGVHEAWRDDEKRPLKSRIAHGIDRVLMSPTLAEPRDEALKQSNALVSLVKQSVRDGKAGDVKAAVAEHEATVKPDQRQNNATISKVLEGVVAKTEQAIPAEKAAEKKITKTMAKSTSMESGIDDDLCR